GTGWSGVPTRAVAASRMPYRTTRTAAHALRVTGQSITDRRATRGDTTINAEPAEPADHGKIVILLESSSCFRVFVVAFRSLRVQRALRLWLSLLIRSAAR